MALTTDREGMRAALDALRIGRDPGIAAADFIIDAYFAPRPPMFRGSLDWSQHGVLPGDHVEWVQSAHDKRIAVRVTLREEAPTFVDLMAA